MTSLLASALVLLLVLGGAAGLLFRYLQRARAQIQQQAQQHQALLRQARQQAAAVERERIYADMHDDVGAKLLTLMHSSSDAKTADLARALHQDLRDVVSRTLAPPPTLRAALAGIHDEAEQRLAGLGAALVWQQPDTLPEVQLDAAQSLHLFRIVREAISNAIRHAAVRLLRVRVVVQGAVLVLDITDDGSGLQPQAAPSRGMQSMQSRARELQGALHWDAGTQGGTKVVLEFPLPQTGSA